MPFKRTIIIGDSHTAAIKQALPDFADDDLGAISIDRVARAKDALQQGMSEEAIEKLTSATGADDLVVSALGGNQFNVFGLLRHPQPFDFEDAEEPDGALEPEARVIPARIIEATFDRYMRGRDTNTLKKMIGGKARVVHLAAPPPKSDDEYIVKNAETYFKNLDIEAIGISPKGVRLKLWRVQSRAMRRVCEELGVAFLDAPAETLDEDGFLKREYYGRDATHANAAYGARVLENVARHLKGPQ